MTDKTTIGIIDDHAIVRQGLKELLHKVGNYRVTHEFENGTDFLNAIPFDNPPDLFILDYSMPKLNGLEVLRELSNRDQPLKVLFLTQHFDEQVIDTAYNLGARGFLHKDCSAQDLKFAIDYIVEFGYYNISEILKRIRQYEDKPAKKVLSSDLTNREKQFMTLVCDERELTYDDMAKEMGVSIKSIESYRTHLFDRFSVKSKVGLVLFSFHNRLTPPFS